MNYQKSNQVKIKTSGETGGETGIENKPNKTEENILQILSSEPGITQPALAAKIGLSEGGVRYAIKDLKKKKMIERVGPNKGGYWRVSAGSKEL